jgi:glycosyltransferase involved in cell wall biosynthesis
MTKINIVGRHDNRTGIGQHAKSFLHTLQDTMKLNFIETRPDNSDKVDLHPSVTVFESSSKANLGGDGISIYTDVLSNGSHDQNIQKVPSTLIRLGCVVFDSNRLPPYWVNLIEKHFDAVLVPSHFLIDVLRKSGVARPIFYLPFALPIAQFNNFHPQLQTNRPFTFMTAGLVERRKNMHMVIQAFEQTFTLANKDVRLIVKLSEVIDEDYFKKYFVERGRYANSNIEFVTENLSKDRYIELMRSVDCFVTASGGEGYSIIPRESMAMGKPTIITDALAHSDICDSGLVETVPCTIPVPAYYPHINSASPYIGISYEPYVEDLVQAMRKVYANRAQLFAKDAVEARKKWAEKFSYESLAPYYRTLVAPKKIERGSRNVIMKDKLMIADPWLFKKYERLFQGQAEITESGQGEAKKVVVQVNDAGFFSVFNTLVSYLAWELKENPDSVVLPDWRIKKLRERFGDKIKSFCYGTESDGNIWLKLFQPLPFRNIPIGTYNNEHDLYEDAIPVNNWNEFREPLLTYTNAYKLYKLPDFGQWREWYHRVYNKYIKVLPHIKERADKFAAENFRGKVVIAAHVRHPSHSMEQPGGRLPTVELFKEKIDQIIASQNLQEDKFVIFIATDQDSVVDYFRQHYPKNLVHVAGVKRVTKEDDKVYQGLNEKEQNKEGHQIQHKMAADASKWTTKMAEEVIVDVLLLAHSDYFVHVTSNIATAVSFINPKTEMIYCE